MKLTNNQIDIAVEWWGNILKNPKFEHGDYSETGMLTKFIAKHCQNPITNEGIKKFKINLKKLLKNMNKSKYRIDPYQLSCDYHPCLTLFNAIKNTKINDNNFPWKTMMRFDENGKVFISYGYGQPFIEIS